MECLIINTSSCTEFLWFDSIIYCCAEGSYSRIYLVNNRSVYCSKNLSWIEQHLKSRLFVRMHRSHIVNLKYISKVYKTDGKVSLVSGEKLPISKSRTKEFWDSVQELSAH